MTTYAASDVQVYADVLGLAYAAPLVKALSVNEIPLIERTSPVVAVNTPVAGSTLAASSTPIVLDVTDAATLQRVIIYATFSDSTPPEMVYDGTSFTSAYDAASARSSIAGGYRYSIVRDAGWGSNPTLKTYALDSPFPYFSTKNEMDFTSFSWVYVADATAPVIQNPSPAAASTLPLSTTSVAVEIVDPGSGVVSGTVVIAISNGGLYEVAYTGGAFASGYSGSRDVISGGFRYHITRDAGWGTDPTLTAQADDAKGNRLSLGATTVVWDFTPAPPDSPPTIENITPTPSGPLEQDEPIEFDIVDDYGIRRCFVYARYAALGTWDVIFDGTDFGPKYEADSTFEVDGDTTHFVLSRDDGWPDAPELFVLPVDIAGNEP